MNISSYKGNLQALHQWVYDVKMLISQRQQFRIDSNTVADVCNGINVISNAIREDYGFYSRKLHEISQKLFFSNQWGQIGLEYIVFGELIIIEEQLYTEPINMQWWSDIHPRICNISKALYADGHFSAAAEKAIKEVETQLREIFDKLKPGETKLPQTTNIINALFSNDFAHYFIDMSKPDSSNYRDGIQKLFQGMFAAYRNPSAHRNIEYGKREAMEQIMLASQLMYILDKKI